MDQKLRALLLNVVDRPSLFLKEHEAYEVLKYIGIRTPQHQYFSVFQEDELKKYLLPGKRYVLKADVPGIIHKTQNGAVVLDFNTENADYHLNIMKQQFQNLEGFIVAEFLTYDNRGPSNGEFLLSAYRDVFFGPQICLGLGGVNSEEFQQILTIPALQEFDLNDYKNTLVYKCLTGKLMDVEPCASDDDIINLVKIMQKLITTPPDEQFPYIIQQIEVNPIVFQPKQEEQTDYIALDAFIQLQQMDRKTWDKKAQLLFDHKNVAHLRRLKYLFAPDTVAIAGVSTKNPNNPGNVILHKIKENFKDKSNICIIHPKQTEYEGFKCYKNVQDLEKKPDLYIIATAAEQASKQLHEACENDVAKSIFIISAGFEETVGGKHYTESLKDHVKQHGIVEFPLINGPNTLGYYYRDFTTTFTQDWRSSMPEEYEYGDYVLISQSGACLLESRSALGKIQPKFGLSVGNQTDLSHVDALQWFLGDEDENVSCREALFSDKRAAKVFGLYIEGLKEGEGNRLVRLIRRARQQKKMVIIYKAGRSHAGSVSVQGHTGSVAGSYEQFYANITRAGGVVVDTYTQFIALLQTAYLTYSRFAALGRHKQLFAISAITNAGFQKCQVGDLLFRTRNQAAQVVDFSGTLGENLHEFFKKHGLAKIVDVCRILDVTPMLGQQGLAELARLLAQSDAVDLLLVTLLPECDSLSLLSTNHARDPTDSCELNENGIVRQLIKLQKEINKPIIVSVSSGYKYQKTRQLFLDAGIPAFEQIGDAAVCIRQLTTMWANVNTTA